MQTIAPVNLQELEQRCQQIAGSTIGSLAKNLNLDIPIGLLHAKGWIGQLLEAYLGADASSKALPDFKNLGIELKTIPVTKTGKALESTYVCTVQTNKNALNWHESWVYNKLRHVLWVPILATPDLAITDRVIFNPILWLMDPLSEEVLRTDWEELMDMLQLGFGKSLSAKFGTYLHIRPKAANSKVLVDYIDENGNLTKVVPKGFYLRSSFTSMILKSGF